MAKSSALFSGAVPTASPLADGMTYPVQRRHPLDSLFAPQSIAVIGATERPGSLGSALVNNLKACGRPVYAINPRRTSVHGIESFPRIGSAPPTDLAIIGTPAATVPGIVRECAEAGVRGVIIVSAGFKERGPSGVDLERQVLAEARRGQMRILGPNCLGAMSPGRSLNATFAAGMAKPGSVAFLSQSGALCTAVLDWSLRENVGFSAFVSVGSMLDLAWGDLVGYFGDDPQTRSIVIYMESVGDARSFLSAVREVAITKPIIVIKVGRSEAAAKAAASHTGSLTGSDEVFDAALRRVGALRVDTIEELFDMAEVLAKQQRPMGSRLSIVTNAGGPGALATDALAGSGGSLAQLSDITREALDKLLPPHWSHGNPIDVLGDADPERFTQAVELAVNDVNTDGVLAILTPQAMTDAAETARQLKAVRNPQKKPILASWMGGSAVEEGDNILNAAGIPTFKYPDRAARAFQTMWRYAANLCSLYETPLPRVHSDVAGSDREAVSAIIDGALERGRTLLTEIESKRLLRRYHIPVTDTRLARNEAQAVSLASSIGYPVALKLHSETITHKSDAGGVALNLASAGEVRAAWSSIETSVREKAGTGHFLGVTVQPMASRGGVELILGSSVDSQFGPVLLFGAGGLLAEVFKDKSLGLPPLNTTLARRMMERTRIFSALNGTGRYKPVDLARLEQILVSFSHLVAEHPQIAEIDINPLSASSEQLVALDARILLHPPGTPRERLPKLAIRPYPIGYISHFTFRGTSAIIRPIKPEDEPLMAAFHRSLSEESIYLRYFAPLRLDLRVAHERLSRICFIDYAREMVLVVERQNPNSGLPEIISVGRLTRLHGSNSAEFAVVVADAFQRLGIGSELLRRLIFVARDERLSQITATILGENRAMIQIARKAGFSLERVPGMGVCEAELPL